VKVLLNGIEVAAFNANSPIGTIAGGQLEMNVSEDFKKIESTYRAQLQKKAGPGR
jgi:hypothetical protein